MKNDAGWWKPLGGHEKDWNGSISNSEGKKFRPGRFRNEADPSDVQRLRYRGSGGRSGGDQGDEDGGGGAQKHLRQEGDLHQPGGQIGDACRRDGPLGEGGDQTDGVWYVTYEKGSTGNVPTLKYTNEKAGLHGDRPGDLSLPRRKRSSWPSWWRTTRRC